ncbi:MAG: hypothetical protein V1752_03410 [Candidatus Firestonebacteria bacterium]
MQIPFIPIIDSVNLAFHEAGHIIFGVFGIEFLTALGGTLAQLLFPLSAFIYFHRKEQRLSSMITLVWFGENFLNIGTYMKDALKLELPLAGGGLHDWTYMFGELGVITKCETIGNTAYFAGFAIMLYALINIGFSAYRKIRNRPIRDQ